MGKVQQLVSTIREYDIITLLKRYEKTVSARAVRNYLAMEYNTPLDVEIGLITEEIMARITARRPIVKTGPLSDIEVRKLYDNNI